MSKRKKQKQKKRRRLLRWAKATPKTEVPQPRDFTALVFSLLSFLFLWIAMPGPGRGHWWLAWPALTPLIWLIHSPSPPHKVLRQVWIASLIFWLVMMHFVRLPLWPLWFGWLALATYLAVYGPIFVWLSRAMVHRFHIPTVIAAPIVFTGLEWIRVTFLSGFGLACVSHTQYLSPKTMQIAELFGAYGVTFLIVSVAAAVSVASSFSRGRISTQATIPTRIVHAFIAVAVFVGVCGIGTQQLNSDAQLRKSAEAHRHPKVALIQTSIDTVLKQKTFQEAQEEFLVRCDLTQSALLMSKELDLIVWPESSFMWSDFLTDLSPTDTAAMRRQNQQLAWQAVFGNPSSFGDTVPLLAGSTTIDPQAEEVFNSALLFDKQGNVDGRYYKIHLVMFGEYFPVVHSIPILKEFIKGFRSLNEGAEFARFETDKFSAAPNICFESTVPHLIRRQLNALEDGGKEVDFLINVTNDGWFFGTSCLDLHLACNTFRAVETRRPVLVSANTGLSAHIDEFGRHVQLGPRRKEAELICEVRVPFAKTTVYRQWGAWVATVMGWIVALVAIADVALARKPSEPELDS